MINIFVTNIEKWTSVTNFTVTVVEDACWRQKNGLFFSDVGKNF